MAEHRRRNQITWPQLIDITTDARYDRHPASRVWEGVAQITPRGLGVTALTTENAPRVTLGITAKEVNYRRPRVDGVVHVVRVFRMTDWTNQWANTRRFVGHFYRLTKR